MRYTNICKEKIPITVAYNDDNGPFQIDRKTKTMVEFNVHEDFYLQGIFLILCSFFCILYVLKKITSALHTHTLIGKNSQTMMLLFKSGLKMKKATLLQTGKY